MTSLVRSPPWTPEEDERLRKLALTGTSVAAMAKQISAALQRSAALPVEGCGGQIEAESEGEMKQVGARHDIIREWRSLPKEQRQTDEQAEAFAMQIKDKYKFSNDSADPYQTVRGWLLSYLSLRLLSLPDLGSGSIAYLRETLGLPSTDGVRPLGKKPA